MAVSGREEQVDRLIERVAGLDVHKASVTACVRVPGGDGGRHSQTRTFRTTTAGLVLLRDWLASFGVTVVGMESTGVFGSAGTTCWKTTSTAGSRNARHLRNVPGRKTDVADAAWIAQLVEHGLVRPSFVPPKPIRELRELTRYRKALIHERTREVQRLAKVLEDAGIKLGCVASDVLGSLAGRCWRRWSLAPPTPRSSPSWPGAGCAPSSPRCVRRWPAGWRVTIGCWSPSCWRTWTTWTRRSGGCRRGCPGGRPFLPAAGPAVHHPGR
jgi:Transposase